MLKEFNFFDKDDQAAKHHSLLNVLQTAPLISHFLECIISLNVLLEYINLFMQNLLHISHPYLLEIAQDLMAI